MSAIWGIIDFKKNRISKQEEEAMKAPYDSYRIDSISELRDQHVLFGCGLQNFRPDLAKEQLPYYDTERQIYYTADVYLDNRSELLTKLQISDSSIADGHLLYLAYLKWGANFTNHCLGAYAAAFYHQKEHTAYLYTDSLANRCLNYSFQDQKLIFSTLTTSITNLIGSKPDKKWIAASISTYSPDMFLFPGLTPFENIHLMLPARELTCNSSGIRTRLYWNPVSIKEKIRFENPQEYEKILIQTLETCIHSFLDTPNQVACTLSSGLDSSTVACISAKHLEKQEKQLYSYTSIPLKEYKSDHQKYYITDESEGVQLICEQYPNIKPSFFDCRESNDLDTLEKVIPLLEFPSKSGHNLTWINDIYKQAYEDGCRILLKGQYGNCTISYGNFFSVFWHTLKHLQWIKAYQMLQGFCQYHHVSKKKAIKTFLKKHWEQLKPPASIMLNELLATSANSQYGVAKQIRKITMHSGGGDIDSFKKRKEFMFEENGLTQLSIYDTKFSLIHGILVRDPLKDRRLIELCCKLPYECVIAGHVERAMVRTYLHDIVPEKIRMNLYRRGLQSADSIYRMQLNWNKNITRITEELQDSPLAEFLDEEKLQEFLTELPERYENADHELMLKIESLFPSSVFYRYFFHMKSNSNLNERKDTGTL